METIVCISFIMGNIVFVKRLYRAVARDKRQHINDTNDKT
jgi:hypothetical protein